MKGRKGFFWAERERSGRIGPETEEESFGLAELVFSDIGNVGSES